MAGRRVDLVRRTDLHDLAEVHHRDPVADVLDDRQVVGDEQVGEPEPLAEVRQQVEDLPLDRDVEGGDRLVADDELGLDARGPARRRCAGAGRRRTRAGSATRRWGRGRPGGAGRRSAPAWRRRAARSCVSMGSAMVAPTVIRGSSEPYGSWKMICIRRRILRSPSDLRLDQVDAVEGDLALRRLAQPDQRAPGRALAAAGLADQPERLAATDGERDAVDRLHRPDGLLEDARADREVDLEVLDLDQVVLGRRARLGPVRHRRGHAIHPSGWVAQQRARWPWASRSVSIGSCSRQMSRTYGQRGLKRQASGGEISTGGIPSIVRSFSPRTSSSCGSESQQAPRVRHARLLEQLVHRGGLDDPARVHDVDAIAHAGGDAEVVGDHQDGRAELVGELLDQLEDLGLDGHVERGRGLVGEDELGVAREGDRDHDALAHAARELERVVPEALLGPRDADLREQLDDAVARGRVREAHVLADRLGDLVADGEGRVQARQRVLEDEPDLLARAACGCRRC